MEGEIISPAPRRKRRTKKVSTKMIRYVQNRAMGMSRRQAAIKAGYGKDAAANPGGLEKQQQYKTLMKDWKQQFFDSGLDQDFMVDKFKEWLTAQKKVHKIVGRDDKGRPEYDFIDSPDYDTQLKAFREWKELTKDQESEGKQVRRRLTLEEFVGVSGNDLD